MKKVHLIPVDDIQTNHNIYSCTCKPVINKRNSLEFGDHIEVVHRYTDNKGYIKEVCKELNIQTPKFSYHQLSQDTD